MKAKDNTLMLQSAYCFSKNICVKPIATQITSSPSRFKFLPRPLKTDTIKYAASNEKSGNGKIT